jgi:hypothetical protein
VKWGDRPSFHSSCSVLPTNSSIIEIGAAGWLFLGSTNRHAWDGRVGVVSSTAYSSFLRSGRKPHRGQLLLLDVLQ